MEDQTVFEELLKKAQEQGAVIMASPQGSRAHSISMNHLETAQLWAAQDRKEKERIADLTDDDDVSPEEA